MPNTGKPSPNCHLCRKRRVKCDLGRPQCQRCIKYGVQCPGYRDDQELRFQHADSATFDRRRRRKQHAGDTSSDVSGSTTPGSTASWATASQASSRASTPPLPLVRSVRQHWTAESVPLVLGCYSQVGFLPELFKGIGEDHCLAHAGQVFAKAYVINRFKTDNNNPRELSMYLGKALESVSAAIRDPRTCASDTTIAAVWLLGNYELLMGGLDRRSFITRQETPAPVNAGNTGWYIHSEGLLSLLRARGDAQLYIRSGRQIFWTMHNIIQIRCTVTNTPCPPEFDHWLDIVGETLQPGEALLLKTGRYIAAVSTLLSKLLPIARNGDFDEACARYDDLLSECDKAELDMLEWIQSSPQSQVEPGQVDGYFWNAWRSARIKLHHMMILLTNIVSHAPNCPFQPEALRSRRALCLEIVAATAQEVVDSMPESLGGMMADLDPQSPAVFSDALRLVWPLSHLYVIPTIPRNLRIVARKALHKIGKEKGIRVALTPRPGGAGFPPAALAGIAFDDLQHQDAETPSVVSEIGDQSP